MDGSGLEFLHQKAGGSVLPPSHATVDNRQHFVYQEGKTVFKFAVTNMAEVSYDIMERNQLKADDIAWLVQHQANKRIIDATAQYAVAYKLNIAFYEAHGVSGWKSLEKTINYINLMYNSKAF